MANQCSKCLCGIPVGEVVCAACLQKSENEGKTHPWCSGCLGDPESNDAMCKVCEKNGNSAKQRKQLAEARKIKIADIGRVDVSGTEPLQSVMCSYIDGGGQSCDAFCNVFKTEQLFRRTLAYCMYRGVRCDIGVVSEK